ncbi:hypothetical protein GCM10011376_16610 [Nocardioides flavus (ex Wang et al. 2016)]|uniref:Uncharacterized protein n=1 Tax=Nocardioides flavus (ex Wang et al. 2016) TaxID=2058780 RepID=A0ABQ3HHM0_9ACTN|nr:hypothetical protein [Nocardioides flavus (ex Wang et al. 2016)]GHE17051.1 hypothetical protein GCM10011376_16610 [Nocardioides flavus (ex Wang et al. 2016)]
MNHHSLAAAPPRRRWLRATAGAIGTAAVAALLAVPAAGDVALLEPPVPGIGLSTSTGPATEVARPCYLARPGGNTVRGWEQPVCGTGPGTRTDDAVRGYARPAPDHLP